VKKYKPATWITDTRLDRRGVFPIIKSVWQENYELIICRRCKPYPALQGGALGRVANKVFDVS
jgi:hypothetical protein